MPNPTKTRAIIVDVTEDEYQADRARGLQADEVLQPGRHTFKRGGFLTRLWQQQGKQQEAHRMLSDIYTWFTEGFDTKDLQEAKALLDALT